MADISMSEIDSHINKCKRVKKTTRFSLLRSVVFLSIIPIVLLSVFSYISTISQVIEKKTDNIHIVVNNISESTSDLFQDRISLVRSISNDVSGGTPPNEIRHYLTMLVDSHSDIESMSITDENGMQLVRSDKSQLLDISDRDFFIDVMAGSDLIISNALISRTTEKPCLVIASAVKNEQGTTIGISTLLINLNVLYSRLEQFEFNSETSLYIVDSTGKVAFHPEDEIMGMSEPTMDWMPVSKALEEKSTGSVIYRNPLDNKKYLSSYAYIPDVQWSVIIEQDYSSLIRQTLLLLSDSLIIAIIFIVAVFIIGGIAYRRLSKEITLTKREGLKMARALAEDHEKTFFYANITHELRTPINALLSSIQLLELENKRDKGLCEALDRPLKIMDQNCMRLLKLVNNYIDITKIDTGFQELQLVNTDVVPLIEDIVMSVSDYAKQKGIRLEFDTNVEELEVACDPEKIERIVLNLLSNALKFTPDGGKIRVDLQAGKKTFKVAVSDEGCGINPKNIDKVFTRFWQEENEECTCSYQGSGIGLSLARSFVELHKGHIKLDSKVDKGTRVTFEIPIILLPGDDNRGRFKEDKDMGRIHIELSNLN
ncbi:MAG TPA: sensor histidine kinase [Bacillota bacterium]|nr:sensor histidine kinase [Bacillota bacterium]